MGRESATSGASKDERPRCFDILAATAGPSPFEARRRGSHLRVTVMERARNDGANGDVIVLQFTSQTPDTSSRSRDGYRPSFGSPFRTLVETRAQERPGAGWHPSPCARKCTRGGLQVSPDRPAFPARWC